MKRTNRLTIGASLLALTAFMRAAPAASNLSTDAASLPAPKRENSAPPVVTVNTLDDCNVIWTSPSRNSFGSMPLGNGDVGLNVWVEENGDLVFYISKIGAFEFGHSLPKLGRVRVRFAPALAVKDFRQTLVLRDAVIEVKAGDVNLKVWVDANAPVIRVTGSSATPRSSTIAVEPLRVLANAESALPPKGTLGVIFNDQADRLAWCYRNQSSEWAKKFAAQNTPELVAKIKDPILHRTSGCVLQAQEFVCENQTTLKTKAPTKTFDCSVRVLSNQPESVQEWLAAAEKPVKPGENMLELQVANTWRNALIGTVRNAVKPTDAATPYIKPWTSHDPGFKRNTPLQPSGMFGPVTVSVEQSVSRKP